MENNSRNIEIGKVAFVNKSEEYWDEPHVMKSHHVYKTKSVTLRVMVEEIRGKQFKGKLIDNNNFEKDGESYIFDFGQLLCEQNYTDFESLGKWKYSDLNKY